MIREEFFFTSARGAGINGINQMAAMNDTVTGTASGAPRAPEGRIERESGRDGERRRSHRHQLSSRSSYASSGESRRDMRRSRRERRKAVVFWFLLVMLIGVLAGSVYLSRYRGAKVTHPLLKPDTEAIPTP